MTRSAHRSSLLDKLRIETHAMWLAARDPRTPRSARVLGLLIAAYALSPIDLIPDFIPVLGLVDDLVIVPAGLWLFLKLVPPEVIEQHRGVAAAAAERPRSRGGMLLIFAIWIIAALLAWSLLRWVYA